MQQARIKLIDVWLAAAEGALARNISTLAVLPISELLEADGWLARLRAKGYAIQEPESGEESVP